MFRTHFVIAAIIGAVATAPANAQEPVPAVLDNLKAHEVVEAFTSEAKTLGLTSVQLRQLDSLQSPCGTSDTSGCRPRATRRTRC
jgi:hypothetical protein